MAPTFRHGKNAFFSVTSATGGTINLSSGIDDVKFSRKMNPADVTHFGNNDKNYIVGLRDTTLSLTGIFSSTPAKNLDALLGSTSGGTFIYGPESTATGRRKFTGSSWLTGLDYEAPVADKVKLALNFQVTGAVTSTNF